MTTSFSRVSGFRCLFLVLTTLFFTAKLSAQSDTLHLNYDNIKTIPHDTTLAKLDAWIKKLNGTHVNINVYAYYSKPDFKKYAQERADELFLTLNRKARSLFTIEFIGPKRGENSQRSRVDIVYQKAKTPEEVAAEAAAKAKEEAAAANAKAEEKKKKEEEKAKKDAAKKEEKSTKTKSEVASEQAIGADKKDKKTSDKSGKEPKGSKVSKPKIDEKTAANGGPGNKGASKGAFVTQSDVAQVKSARLIVPRTNNPEIDSILTIAVKGFWKFNPNVEYGTMTYNEAKALAKTDKNVLIFIVADAVSKSLVGRTAYQDGSMIGTGPTEYRIQYVSSGSGVMLEDGKGKLAITAYFPGFTGDRIVYLESLAFAVSEMNSLLFNLEKYNIKNNITFNRPFRQNALSLKDKILLLPEGWLHEKLDVREIPSLYEGRFQVVDNETWANAILQKKNFAYVMVVPYPSGGKFIYLHYLMDAATGDVLFISQPRMAVSVYGANVSAANTGFINEKNLRYYNDAFHMKLKDNDEDEKAEKATEAESKSTEDASGEKKEEVKKETKKKEKKEEEPKKEKKKKEKEGDSKE